MARRPEPQEKQINFRLAAGLARRLEAASAALGKTQTDLLAHALEVFLDNLPKHDQQLIAAVLARRDKA